MPNATWPIGVDDAFDAPGFEESLPNGMLRTQMDAGEPKQRRRFSAAPRPIIASILLPDAQVPIFLTFFEVTLALGALRFDLVHPRTGVLRTFRFTEPPKMQPVANGAHWRVSMKLEVLP